VRGTLFEVGAANGAFLKIMQDRGWRVSGIDICPDAVRFGRATFNVDLVVGDAEYYDTSERFDAVCMYQTLEHMPNPLLALRKAHTWLRPGGVLVIEVPNADSFDIRISPRSEELILDLPRHMSHFTPRFLCHQLERLGFQTLQCHLYPAHVLLTVLSARRTTLNASNEATIAKGVHVLPQALPPLARLPAGTWKSRLLQMLASIAPGWRFTVIARTSPSR
jgi:SAM-dependent methyltransferase